MSSTSSSPAVPLELVHNIASYASPSVLASLAQTCMAYCVEAERLLYCTISSDVCLTTLVSNEHKAMLVRCLDFQTNLDFSEIDLLLRTLTNAKSLETLRIGLQKYSFYDDNWRSATTDLENVLCCGTFDNLLELHFYNITGLNVPRIVQNLPALECFSARHLSESAKTIKSFTESLPIVYAIDNSVSSLQLFPDFYSPERLSSIPQVFEQMVKNGHPHFSDPILELSFWVDGIYPQIQEFVKNMSTVFKHVQSLIFIYEDNFNMSITEVKSLLSEYPTSEVLYFLDISRKKHWTIGDATNECTTDVKVSVLQELETVCPKLAEVSFPDDENLCRFCVQDDGILGPWTSD